MNSRPLTGLLVLLAGLILLSGLATTAAPQPLAPAVQPSDRAYTASALLDTTPGEENVFPYCGDPPPDGDAG